MRKHLSSETYMYMINALNDKVATATPYTHHSPRAAVAQQRWGGGQRCLDRACPCGPGHTLPVTCLRSSSRASLHCVGRSLRALLACFQTPVTSVAEHHSQPYYYFYHYSTTTEILYLTYQPKTKAPEQPTNRPRLYHGSCYICGGFREEVLQGSCTPWHGHRYMIYHYIAVTSYLRLLARRRTARSRRAGRPSCRRRDGCGADLSMEGMSIPFPYQRVVFCNFTMPYIALHSLLGTFCE